MSTVFCRRLANHRYRRYHRAPEDPPDAFFPSLSAKHIRTNCFVSPKWQIATDIPDHHHVVSRKLHAPIVFMHAIHPVHCAKKLRCSLLQSTKFFSLCRSLLLLGEDNLLFNAIHSQPSGLSRCAVVCCSLFVPAIPVGDRP